EHEVEGRELLTEEGSRNKGGEKLPLLECKLGTPMKVQKLTLEIPKPTLACLHID
ncbi:unnamed protein product, partial [Ilex paraguariensis]